MHKYQEINNSEKKRVIKIKRYISVRNESALIV